MQGDFLLHTYALALLGTPVGVCFEIISRLLRDVLLLAIKKHPRHSIHDHAGLLNCVPAAVLV